MTVETATYIGDLDATKPGPSDPKSEGDDHLRLIKSILKVTFPAFTGAMPIAHDQVASKDYVNQTAFSSTLPAQTGNAGKMLTTDGVASSWSTAIKATVMRFADGADATKLAAFDLSGLTTGTTRTYALPDASGTFALRTETAMQLVAQATIGTSVANIDFLTAFSSGYDKYVIEVIGLTANTQAPVSLRAAVSGSVITSSNYFYGEAGSGTTQADIGFYIATPNTASPLTVTITVSGANSSANDKVISAFGCNLNTSTVRVPVSKQGSCSATGVLSGFRLYLGTGLFTAGTIRVYGIKNN